MMESDARGSAISPQARNSPRTALHTRAPLRNSPRTMLSLSIPLALRSGTYLPSSSAHLSLLTRTPLARHTTPRAAAPTEAAPSRHLPRRGDRAWGRRDARESARAADARRAAAMSSCCTRRAHADGARARVWRLASSELTCDEARSAGRRAPERRKYRAQKYDLEVRLACARGHRRGCGHHLLHHLLARRARDEAAPRLREALEDLQPLPLELILALDL